MLQLRQVCLVAEKLQPAIEELTHILGINTCYVDPGVAHFGLENTLMAIGKNFLEVVAPIQEGTAAGRYLERRKGDGGYMVITQADSLETQQAVRKRALDAGVRIAHESQREDWHLCQLHPSDMIAAFLEVESDAYNDFSGHWMPVGGTGWEEKVKQDVTREFTGVELQSADPAILAALWGKILNLPVRDYGSGFSLSLNNAQIRFVETRDGRGPGLGGLDLVVSNRAQILDNARSRGCYISEDQVTICGTRFYLHD